MEIIDGEEGGRGEERIQEGLCRALFPTRRSHRPQGSMKTSHIVRGLVPHRPTRFQVFLVSDFEVYVLKNLGHQTSKFLWT